MWYATLLDVAFYITYSEEVIRPTRVQRALKF